jgi:rubredoxin
MEELVEMEESVEPASIQMAKRRYFKDLDEDCHCRVTGASKNMKLNSVYPLQNDLC